MKPLLILTVSIFSSFSVHAQKALVLANFGGGINAPVTNAAGQRITAPGPFVADLFYSTNTNSVPNPLGNDSFIAAQFNQLSARATSSAVPKG
jgi:hypothetical protein